MGVRELKKKIKFLEVKIENTKDVIKGIRESIKYQREIYKGRSKEFGMTYSQSAAAEYDKDRLSIRKDELKKLQDRLRETKKLLKDVKNQ